MGFTISAAVALLLLKGVWIFMIRTDVGEKGNISVPSEHYSCEKEITPKAISGAGSTGVKAYDKVAGLISVLN